MSTAAAAISCCPCCCWPRLWEPGGVPGDAPAAALGAIALWRGEEKRGFTLVAIVSICIALAAGIALVWARSAMVGAEPIPHPRFELGARAVGVQPAVRQLLSQLGHPQPLDAVGVIALGRAISDEKSAARATAVLVLVGVVNIPIIKYSVEWWNTLHQPATFKLTEKPSMPPEMWVPLLLSVLGLYLIFGWLACIRMQSEILIRESRTRWVRELVMAGRN